MATLSFIMISRLLYDKGYTQYVEAARIIKQKYPKTIFKILGSIDEDYPNHVPYEKIKEDIESGVIEYLGYDPNVRSVIENTDCVVLPSFYNEGLSRVLMEALAMKKVIITTNIPGCKETVDNGLNGYLCEPKSTSSLVECMQRVILLSDEERIKMGNIGRKKAEDIFDISKVISTYHQITNQYLNK